MPTPAELDDFQQAVGDVQTLMVAALVEQWAAATASNPGESVDELGTLVLDLVAEYGQAAAATAVEFYDSVRPPGSPPFQPITVVRDDLIAGPSLNWMTEPLVTETYQDSLDRMAAVAQKATFEAVIETIGEATEEDPLEVRYARFPQNDDPCAYCVFRASRGAVFYSEATATRGDHTHCMCKVTMVFSDEELPYLKAPYLKAYYAGETDPDTQAAIAIIRADKSLSGERRRKAIRSAILAGMRRANGSR